MHGLKFKSKWPQSIAILEFLDANGASRFASEWLDDELDHVSLVVQIVLAPKDEAIRRLEIETGMTLRDITRSREGNQILMNHGSNLPMKSQWPIITSWNGKTYGHSQVDIDALKPSISTLIRTRLPNQPNFDGSETVVMVIDAIIIHDEQLIDLKRYKSGFSKWWRPIETIQQEGSFQDSANNNVLQGTELAQMNKDIFRTLVSRGQLRGKDVFALCTANADIATLCNRDNYFIYQQLLKSEFNYKWRVSDLPVTAKDMYTQFHHYRFDLYVKPKSMKYGYVKVKDDYIKDKLVSRINKTYRFSSEPYDYVSIPLDDTFERRKEVSWVIYIRGKPRTATLLKISNDEPSNSDMIYTKAYRELERGEYNGGGRYEEHLTVYMSSNDLREYLDGKQVELINSRSNRTTYTYLGDLFVDMLDNLNIISVELLIDGQKEIAIVVPVDIEGYL